MKPVPRSITVNTGDQHRVQRTIDDFFGETADYIRARHPAKGPEELQIDSGNIAYGQGVITDDRVTHLKYKQRIVACVLETRTDLNYVHYDFFRNVKGL